MTKIYGGVYFWFMYTPFVMSGVHAIVTHDNEVINFMFFLSCLYAVVIGVITPLGARLIVLGIVKLTGSALEINQCIDIPLKCFLYAMVVGILAWGAFGFYTGFPTNWIQLISATGMMILLLGYLIVHLISVVFSAFYIRNYVPQKLRLGR